MTSGDLNIDLTWKWPCKIFRSFHGISYVVYRLSLSSEVFYIRRDFLKPPTATSWTFYRTPRIGLIVVSPEVKGSQSYCFRWNGLPWLMFTLGMIEKLFLLHRVSLSEASKHAGHLEVVFEIWLRVSLRLHRLFRHLWRHRGRGHATPFEFGL